MFNTWTWKPCSAVSGSQSYGSLCGLVAPGILELGSSAANPDSETKCFTTAQTGDVQSGELSPNIAQPWCFIEWNGGRPLLPHLSHSPLPLNNEVDMGIESQHPCWGFLVHQVINSSLHSKAIFSYLGDEWALMKSSRFQFGIEINGYEMKKDQTK